MTDRRRNAIRPGALLRPALLAAAIAAALAVRASVTLAVDHSPPPIAPIATNRDANVLFVDARVPEADVIAHAAMTGTRIVRIDAARDGIDQIADYLDAHRGAVDVGIVAHGAPGELAIGANRVDAAALDVHAAKLAHLRNALADDAQLSLYSCATGAGAKGLRFVDELARRTGRSVAASDHAVGIDGDWNLQIVAGNRHNTPLLDAAALGGWAHDLARLIVTSNADAGAGTLRNTVAAASAGDVINFSTSMTVGLTSGQIAINKDLVIESLPPVQINAGRHSRVFSIGSGANVAITGVEITGGLLSGNGGDHDKNGGSALGAGISNAGNLSLSRVSIVSNLATGGGAGGCLFNLIGTFQGGGGGGGGGFGVIGGGNGGAGGSYAGVAGKNGIGGTGGEGLGPFAIQFGGEGGALLGGQGGASATSHGNNGAMATVAGIGGIGGGGAGGTYSSCATGDLRGGTAAGGLYNAPTGKVIAFGGSYLKSNGGAAGGSEHSALSPLGYASGAVFNSGQFSITAAGASASTGNVGVGSTVFSGNGFINAGGTQNLAYTNAAPVIGSLDGDSVAFTQGDVAVYIDAGADATLTDADSTNFFGGHVSVAIPPSPYSAQDVLSIANQGTGAGQIGVAGSVVTYGGIPLGVLSPGPSVGSMVVTFSSVANAMPAAVQALLRALTYTDTNTSNPNLTPRIVGITVDDGDGGVSAKANVTVNLASSISLGLDDHLTYARYGQIVDYTVTLANTGVATASNLAVGSTYPHGLDSANAQWTCAPINGATCANGSGPFADTATLPANSSATWLVSVPVPIDTIDDTAEMDVSATGKTAVSDVDTLVIFRDGFDGGTGPSIVQLATSTQVLAEGTSEAFGLPASTGNRIDVVKALRIGTSDVRVERIALGSFQYVRLLQHAQGGAERASAWVAVKAAAQLAISSVAGAGDQRIVLLEGAEQSLALPLTR